MCYGLRDRSFAIPMNVSYFFKKCTAKEKEHARAYVESKLSQIQKFTQELRADAAQLEVTIERFPKKHAYKVTFLLHLPTGKLYAWEDDHTITEAIDFAKDKIVEKLKRFHKRLHGKKIQSARRDKEWEAVHAWAQDQRVAPLEQDKFFERVRPLLGGLRRYIEREIGYAYMTGVIAADSIEIDAVLDETLLDAFAHLHAWDDAVPLEQFLYARALPIIKKRIRTLRRDDRTMLSLEREVASLPSDKKVKAHIPQKATMWDPDDDLTFEQFVAQEIEIDPQEKQKKKELHAELMHLVQTLPEQSREVLFLFALHHMDCAAIARIQGRTERVVQKDFDVVKRHLKKNLMGI